MLIDIYKPDKRKIENGVPYIYDSVRTKWVSEQEFIILFRLIHRNVTGDRFLFYKDVATNFSGYPINKNSIIKEIIIYTDNDVDAEFKIFKNKTTEILTTQFTTQNYKKISDLDLSLSSDDRLSSKVITTDLIDNIVISINYSYYII